MISTGVGRISSYVGSGPPFPSEMLASPPCVTMSDPKMISGISSNVNLGQIHKNTSATSKSTVTLGHSSNLWLHSGHKVQPLMCPRHGTPSSSVPNRGAWSAAYVRKWDWPGSEVGSIACGVLVFPSTAMASLGEEVCRALANALWRAHEESLHSRIPSLWWGR